MGLIKIARKALGIAKDKSASATGALKDKGSGIIKKAGGIVKAIGAKKSTIGTLGFAAAIYKPASKIPGTFPNALEKFKSNLKGKPAKTSTLKDKLKSAGKVALAVGGGAAALYGAEQIAEKLGVRGGAGFVGRRKNKRRSKGRYAYIRVPRNRRGKGKLTRSEERRLRNTARSYADSEGTSRRSLRKKGKRGSKSYMAWVRSFRRKK